MIERIGLRWPMHAGPFMVAAMARLAHVTQGERFFTLRDKWPALKHHVGMMAKKSSNSENFPSLWDIYSDKRFSSSQV